jgi:hypothetical protein
VDASAAISVYPNPANTEIYIDGNSSMDVKLINSLGEVVMSIDKYKSKQSLNVAHLAKGIYFVTISGNGQSTIKKLIIE